MNYAKKAVKGATFILFFSILAQFFGYLVRIILARNLTTSEFGLFYSVFTLFMFVSIFTDFGYGAALIKFTAEFKAKNWFSSLKRSFFMVAGIKISLSFLISLLLFSFSSILAKYYFKSPTDVFIIKIFAIILIINSFNGLLSNIFKGFQKMFYAGLVNFLSKFFFFVFVIFFLSMGFNKNEMLPTFAFAISVFIPLFFLIWPFIKLIRVKTNETIFSSKVLLKKLSAFAFPSMLVGISGIIIGYIDVIILTAFVSLSEVGVYNAVLPTALIIAKLGSGFSIVMLPLVSEINAKKDHARLRKGIKKLHNYGFFSILPLSLILLVFSKEIIQILFGTNFVSGTFPLQILAIGVVFLVIGKINNSIISGMGHPKEVFKVTMWAAILNIVLNLLLIPFIGLVGAAITTTISYLFMFIKNSFKLSNIINMKIIWKDWLKIIFAGLIFLGIMYSFKIMLSLNVYIGGIISICGGGIIYILVCIKFKIIEIKEILHVLRNK